MNDFRYILENTTKKSQCPECGKKVFVRYVDTATKNHLPEQYGRCDREVNCAYWLNPYKDGYSKMIFEQERTGNNSGFNLLKYKSQPKPEQKPASLIDRATLDKSLSTYEVNNFIKYLFTFFPIEIVKVLISKYLIGTSKHWEGSTVFWQADTHGKIKTGKIMLYNPTTGKRIKEPYNHITWVHSALKLKDYNLKQCMFGEHLLNINKAAPIAIVESEKTAIIASAYLPDFVWLACGSLSNLSDEKCKVLKGRKVILYPDLNGFNKWSEKAKLLSGITNFEVSDLLEQNATDTEKQQGLDLADYLIRFDYKEFGLPKQESIPTVQLTKFQPLIDVKQFESIEQINNFSKSETSTKTAYVSEGGKLFIETPYADTYTVYQSIEHYNKRLCLPELQKKESVNILSYKTVIIDLQTLTINLN